MPNPIMNPGEWVVYAVDKFWGVCQKCHEASDNRNIFQGIRQPGTDYRAFHPGCVSKNLTASDQVRSLTDIIEEGFTRSVLIDPVINCQITESKFPGPRCPFYPLCDTDFPHLHTKEDAALLRAQLSADPLETRLRELREEILDSVEKDLRHRIRDDIWSQAKSMIDDALMPRDFENRVRKVLRDTMRRIWP